MPTRIDVDELCMLCTSRISRVHSDDEFYVTGRFQTRVFQNHNHCDGFPTCCRFLPSAVNGNATAYGNNEKGFAHVFIIEMVA